MGVITLKALLPLVLILPFVLCLPLLRFPVGISLDRDGVHTDRNIDQVVSDEDGNPAYTSRLYISLGCSWRAVVEKQLMFTSGWSNLSHLALKAVSLRQLLP